MVLVFLRPADEDPPVAVEPGVARLDDPASGAPAGRSDLVGDLFSASADVRREFIVADELADVGVVVGLVEAKALRSFSGRLRTLDRDRVERALQEEVVVAVGALVLEPDRDTMRLAEDRSLRPFLLYQSDSGRSWGPPTAPWSSRRQPPATTSRSPPPRHTRAAPAARSHRTRRPRATPGTACAPNSTNRSRTRPTRSTASPSAAPTRSPPSRCGSAPSGCGNPTGEPAAQATAARSSPTTSPASANHHPY